MSNNFNNNTPSKLTHNKHNIDNQLEQSGSNLMMDTNYLNLTNAANPNEKSYLIKKLTNV